MKTETWIIGFAEGGFIGPFKSSGEAYQYREIFLMGRVANIHKVEMPERI